MKYFCQHLTYHMHEYVSKTHTSFKIVLFSRWCVPIVTHYNSTALKWWHGFWPTEYGDSRATCPRIRFLKRLHQTSASSFAFHKIIPLSMIRLSTEGSVASPLKRLNASSPFQYSAQIALVSRKSYQLPHNRIIPIWNSVNMFRG